MDKEIPVFGVLDYAGEKTIWLRSREEALKITAARRVINIREARMPEDVLDSLPEWDG